MKALDTVVFYHTFVEKGEGAELAKKYKVRATPTFVVINTQEQTIDRWTGYSKPWPFAEKLAATLALNTTVEEREAAFAASPTEAAAVDLGRVSATKGEFAKSVDYYRQAQKLGTDPEKYSEDIFEQISSGMRDTLFTFEQLKASADEVMAAKKPEGDDRLMVAYMMAQIGRGAKMPELAAPYLKVAVEDTSQLVEPGLARLRKEIRVDHALVVLKDPAKAVELKKANMPEGWLTDPDRINSFAWWCFENKVNLEEAEKLGRQGIELAKEPASKAMIADTVAEICFARGNAAGAAELAGEAVKNDPENKYYKKQLERFQKEMAGSGSSGR